VAQSRKPLPRVLEYRYLYKYSRTCPSNPQHRTYNSPGSDAGREMSPSRIGENSNSSHNNSFNTNSFNTISFSNVSNVNNFSSTDERTEILAWLSPLNPWIRHDDIRAHRVEHVGDWLLRTEEYRNWFDGIRDGESDNSTLLCYGDPGVGKTHIR